MSRESGKIGEDVAVKFLRRRGYKIIERNYRGSRYEVDIVAREGEVLSFIEVKTRAPGKSLSGAESINREKQRRIAQAAQHYLLTHPQEQSSVCRFRRGVTGGGDGEKTKGERTYPECVSVT